MTNMAEDENSDLKCLKNTKIPVLVDEALPDILVVTYEYGVRIFKGVLLDSTKRNLPFGINSLNPALLPPKKPEDDPLYAVNQRFTYTDPSLTKKKNVQLSSKYRNRMTVRLRPRQVLCSKCKGVCNENSENVSKKRKPSDSVEPSPLPIKRSINAPMTRSVYTEQLTTTRKNANKGASLIPKLTRLTAEEEQRALSGNFNNRMNKRPLSLVCNPNSSENQENAENRPHSDNTHSKYISFSNSATSDENEESNQKAVVLPVKSALRSVKRQMRKKRSVDSLEDVSKETTDEQNSNKNVDENVSSEVVPCEDLSSVHSSIGINTRTIKISYGPQGEGTVLKIPAKIDNLESKEDSEENINVVQAKTVNMQTREARRALKKAKKEARRKVLIPSNSPCYLGGTSPRYAIGTSSPRYTIGSASPRQGLGNNSPRYICTSLEFNMPRKRKHKMKHKKKHRENKDRKHKEEEVSSSTHEELKEQCSTQKLSINLKRLQSRYTSSDTKEDNSSSSDDQNEQVPDFPPPNQPLMLRINAQAVSSASGADGARLLVGDVVWGKIHGFPWWPGKILTITNCNNRDFQAHVSWYGSSTSSLMQCDQLSPYLEHFKIRYNKKKRGPYKEAIKQATNEAKENAESKARQPLGNSPSHNLISQVVPPALASPREIDVAS